MRFVSTSPRFTVEVVKEKVRFSNYGDRIVDQEQYNAVFTQDDVTDADLLFVEKEFGALAGRTVLVDEITPTPLLDRVSVFDTDEQALRDPDRWNSVVKDNRGVEHPFKDFVERVLLDRAENHPDFRRMREIPIEPPWPNYLQFQGTLDQLLVLLIGQGHDLNRVLAYERQQGRTQVVEALENAIRRRDEELAQAEQVPA